MRTGSQEISEYALECINEIIDIDKSKDIAKRYKSYIKAFPALIISEGFLLALAFTISKSDFGNPSDSAEKIARRYIFIHVTKWLKERGIITVDDVEKKYKDVIKELSEKEVKSYRLATQEALRVSDWLRRFAEGMIEGEDES